MIRSFGMGAAVCAAVVAQSDGSGAALRARVVAGLESQAQRLLGLSVCYEYSTIDDRGTGHYVWRRTTFAGRDGFAIETSHGTAAQSWEEYPKRVCVYVHENRMVTHWPNELCYAVTDVKDKKLPPRVLDDPFLRVTGLWPLRGVYFGGSLGDLPYDLTEAAYDDWDYKVGERGEVVASSAAGEVVYCPEKNYVVMRRVWRAEGAAVTVRVERFRQVARDLWLPEVVTTVITGSRSETVTGRLRAAARVVERFDFAFQKDPGMAILHGSAVLQVRPGGEWLMERRANEVQSRFVPRTAAVSWLALSTASAAFLVGATYLGRVVLDGRRRNHPSRRQVVDQRERG